MVLNLRESLGHKVKSLRTEKGYTVNELAEAINVSYSALYTSEQGTNRNIIDYIPLILEHYQISIEDFWNLY